MAPLFDPDFSLMPHLFPAAQQPPLRAFGRFVRLADRIADDVSVPRPERVARIDHLGSLLDGCPDHLPGGTWSRQAHDIALGLRVQLVSTGISSDYAYNILSAFKSDAAGRNHETWSDLMDYCQRSAAPIGRFMLALSREDPDRCGKASDSLCATLRILKQIRDCRNPVIEFNRLCIPEEFLRDALISPAHLRAATAKGQTRAVLDRVLDGVDRLYSEANVLPELLNERGFIIHARVVLCRAQRLTRRFRKQDPLRAWVGLSSWQRSLCRISGTLLTLIRS